MLSLISRTPQEIQWYVDKLLPKIQKARDKSKLQSKVKSFLTDAELKKILVSQPSELINLQTDLLLSINSHATLQEYYDFGEAFRKKKRDPRQRALVRRYKAFHVKLQKIFNYNSWIPGDKEFSYFLAKFHDRNTCTYCNRSYTITVEDRNPKGVYNNENRVTRPQFDHWFSKTQFPLLALSFHNLIPSCPVCNSSVKHDDIYDLNTHTHPFIDKPYELFRFNYKLRSNDRYKLMLDYPSNSKIERTLIDLKIEQIYKEHEDYELKDLLDLKYRYSENYIDLLFNKTFSNKIDSKNISRMLFGIESDDKAFHKRPFSKMKSDIITKIRKV